MVCGMCVCVCVCVCVHGYYMCVTIEGVCSDVVYMRVIGRVRE